LSGRRRCRALADREELQRNYDVHSRCIPAPKRRGSPMPVAAVVGALLRRRVSQSISSSQACVLNRDGSGSCTCVGQKRKTCTPKKPPTDTQASKARPRTAVARGTGTGGVVQGAPRSGGRAGEQRDVGARSGSASAHYMNRQRKYRSGRDPQCVATDNRETEQSCAKAPPEQYKGRGGVVCACVRVRRCAGAR
jgi:hypothetical protein